MLELDQVTSIKAQFATLDKRFHNLEKKGIGNTQIVKRCVNCQGEIQ